MGKSINKGLFIPVLFLLVSMILLYSTYLHRQEVTPEMRNRPLMVHKTYSFCRTYKVDASLAYLPSSGVYRLYLPEVESRPKGSISVCDYIYLSSKIGSRFYPITFCGSRTNPGYI